MAYSVPPDIDRIVLEIEFENQQYVKQIEKERQGIENLEKQEQLLSLEVKGEEELTPTLDESIKGLHKQFTLNRDNIQSLKKTLEVLDDHEKALSNKLKSMKVQGQEDREDREKKLAHYENIWSEYKACYETFPKVSELQKKMGELEETKNLHTEVFEKWQSLTEELESTKMEAEKTFVPYEDLNSFIVKVAKMYTSYKKTEQGLKATEVKYGEDMAKLQNLKEQLKKQELKRKEEELQIAEAENNAKNSQMEQEEMEKSVAGAEEKKQTEVNPQNQQQQSATQHTLNISVPKSALQMPQMKIGQPPKKANRIPSLTLPPSPAINSRSKKPNMNVPMSGSESSSPADQSYTPQQDFESTNLLRQVQEMQLHRKIPASLQLYSPMYDKKQVVQPPREQQQNIPKPTTSQRSQQFLKTPTRPGLQWQKHAQPQQNDSVQQWQKGAQPQQNDSMQQWQKGAQPQQDDSVQQWQKGAQPQQNDSMQQWQKGAQPQQNDSMQQWQKGAQPQQNDSVQQWPKAAQSQQSDSVQQWQKGAQPQQNVSVQQWQKDAQPQQNDSVQQWQKGAQPQQSDTVQQWPKAAQPRQNDSMQQKPQQFSLSWANSLPHQSWQILAESPGHSQNQVDSQPSRVRQMDTNLNMTTSEHTPVRPTTERTPGLQLSPFPEGDDTFDMDKVMEKAKLFAAKSPGVGPVFKKRPMFGSKNTEKDEKQPNSWSALDSDSDGGFGSLGCLTTASSFFSDGGGGDGPQSGFDFNLPSSPLGFLGKSSIGDTDESMKLGAGDTSADEPFRLNFGAEKNSSGIGSLNLEDNAMSDFEGNGNSDGSLDKPSSFTFNFTGKRMGQAPGSGPMKLF